MAHFFRYAWPRPNRTVVGDRCGRLCTCRCQHRAHPSFAFGAVPFVHPAAVSVPGSRRFRKRCGAQLRTFSLAVALHCCRHHSHRALWPRRCGVSVALAVATRIIHVRGRGALAARTVRGMAGVAIRNALSAHWFLQRPRLGAFRVVARELGISGLCRDCSGGRLGVAAPSGAVCAVAGKRALRLKTGRVLRLGGVLPALRRFLLRFGQFDSRLRCHLRRLRRHFAILRRRVGWCKRCCANPLRFLERLFRRLAWRNVDPHVTGNGVLLTIGATHRGELCAPCHQSSARSDMRRFMRAHLAVDFTQPSHLLRRFGVLPHRSARTPSI